MMQTQTPPPASAPSPSPLPHAGGGVARCIPLGRSYPDVIALGAFLKATVTVIRGNHAWVSHDLGNLETPQAIAAFEQTIALLVEQTGVQPVCVAHDLHPDFYSTHYAAKIAAHWGVPTVAIQHHYAHLGAVLGEHQQHDGPVCYGLGLDGFGLGLDNASWGGELLAVHPASGKWRRCGGLALLPQPGGDVAARQPWRMAAAVLHRLGAADQLGVRFGGLAASGGTAGLNLIRQMMAKGLNSPLTSSCGRLFDAACGLFGVLPVATFEGEAPMALEALAAAASPAGIQSLLDSTEPLWTLEEDGTLTLDGLLRALMAMGLGPTGQPLPCEAIPLTVQQAGAWLFHHALAQALVAWVVAQQPAVGSIVPLAGGCFFNAVLRREVVRGLEAAGLRPLLPKTLSPGDPAISFGQAWCAATLWTNGGANKGASGVQRDLGTMEFSLAGNGCDG